MRCSLFVALVAAVAAFAGPAYAGGGHYTFSGGTKGEQATVTSALEASSFNWNLVPREIEIHIGRGFPSEARPGVISLDADLLDAGTMSWGVVQHEYAHQVDFFLLGDAQRMLLQQALGGVSWWQTGSLAHGQLASERFASTLAWVYWPSNQNVMKPSGPADEGGSVSPPVFRALIATTLGVAIGDVPANEVSKAPPLKRRSHG
jgi:hypothetical protein